MNKGNLWDIYIYTYTIWSIRVLWIFSGFVLPVRCWALVLLSRNCLLKPGELPIVGNNSVAIDLFIELSTGMTFSVPLYALKLSLESLWWAPAPQAMLLRHARTVYRHLRTANPAGSGLRNPVWLDVSFDDFDVIYLTRKNHCLARNAQPFCKCHRKQSWSNQDCVGSPPSSDQYCKGISRSPLC